MSEIKPYEEDVNGRILCKRHSLIRCSECDYINELEEQNKRYREALEFYADEKTYELHFVGEQQVPRLLIEYDQGQISRKALED